MAMNRNPNHPVHMTSHYKPLEDSVPENVRANQYGNVTTQSFVQCAGVDGTAQRNFEINLTTNTALANILVANVVYYMAGKLIATNDGKTPILTYNQHSVAWVREIGKEGFEFANKASVLGLGIVVKQEEIANGNNRCLEVTMEHSDWDSQERRHKTFKVKYVIHGSKNFIKNHSLYVVGRECKIAGVLVDFIIENKMAIILVNYCSITSGHQPSQASGLALPVKPGAHGKGRNILKLGLEDLASPTTTPTHSPAKRTFAKIAPTAGPSESKGKEKATEGKESEDEAEDEGEVDIEPKEEEEDKIAPKPARGRPRKAILKDAAKRLKKL